MRVLTLSAIASLLLAAPLAAQNYEPALIPSQINASPSAATPLALGDDNTARVELGFDFTYWGQIFDSAWVSSNGFVSFQGPANLCCNGVPIEQAQRNTIYGFWTDLISGSNPYYQRSEGSILFGWYGTSEYGTQNQYTFEIGLFSDSKIQFNYGAMPPLTYHFATAGITGPTSGDNIQLFYGKDTQNLQNQSGILSWIALQTVIDCAATPLEPSCPPPDIVPIQTQTIATIQEYYATDVVIDRIEETEDVAEATEPVQEIVVESQVETASVTAQVAEAIAAERLTPDQVAALAASSVEMPLPGTGVMIQFGAGQSGVASSTFGGAFEIVQSTSSASSVANTIEALNMSSAPAPQVTIAQSDQQGGNAMSDGQGEAMAAIASVPGFAAYTQASLQDRADFYAVRDIYRKRKLPDANFELYRLMQVNDARWQEMVDEQYR